MDINIKEEEILKLINDKIDKYNIDYKLFIDYVNECYDEIDILYIEFLSNCACLNEYDYNIISEANYFISKHNEYHLLNHINLSDIKYAYLFYNKDTFISINRLLSNTSYKRSISNIYCFTSNNINDYFEYLDFLVSNMKEEFNKRINTNFIHFIEELKKTVLEQKDKLD